MDSLSTILGQKDFDEPPEIQAIKKYVASEFGINVGVKLRAQDIVVLVPNAAAANSLRLRGPEIKRRCQLTKRLTFQITSS